MRPCHRYRSESIELARSAGAPPAALAAHLEACPECRRFFEIQTALQAALAKQAALVASETEPAPPDLPPRLLAAFDSARRRTPSRRWWAAAAAALLAVSLPLLAPWPRRALQLPRAAEPPFFQIPYTAPLAPYERARIVRMRVPVAALVAAGFEVHFTDTAAALSADVLFGQDGRAHAVRLVSDSQSDRRTDE
jgi:hypothetical protein